MLFNDPAFLFIFLPAVVLLAALARRLGGPRAVLALLVVASALFYAWWNPVYLPLLAALTVFNFTLARRITAERARAQGPRVTYLLTFGVVVDLLVLAYFKYTDFLIGTSNALAGTNLPLQNIILPLGISFFTFQKIAYLIDASRGEVQKHDFLEYCFFVAFFPQLIAGPIVHHHEIFTQTRAPRAFAMRANHITVGLTIFIIGLFKKVVLADHLAPYATPVFSLAAAGGTLTAFQAWQGAVAYTLQLYFDFSGYSDMAIGAARLFGIRLPLNFESPYQALGIIDFWQRWHMTLSRFLRDYVYFPLGGNRHGRLRRYINLLLTMTIGGLWHGAAWTFVLWGLLHGIYLVINHAWRAVWTPIDAWWSRSIARLVTFLAFVISLVLFRAPSLDAAIAVYRGMLNLPQEYAASLGPVAALLQFLGVRFQAPSPEVEDIQSIYWAMFWIAAVWFVPNTQQIMARFRPAFGYTRASWRRHRPLLARAGVPPPLLRWSPNAASAAVIGLLAALACLSLQHVSEFLYFEF
jgi:D-alanyl-lipoteichoic acid acyltransferase DltB (MBOAT superfamily)